jgi:DnaJ-domain-containing protein 1
MFRRASKLCHPDLVSAQFKAEANVIFIELKTAYEQHNLRRVEEILHLLERGERLAPQPRQNQDKEKLRAEITYLEKRIQATRQEIESLKQSSTYQKLLRIDDWDDYFDDLKAELQRKINRLRRAKPSKQPG